MSFSIVADAVQGLIAPVADYFKNKTTLAAQAQQQQLAINDAINQRQCDLIKQGLAADAAWEMASITAGQSSRNFELYLLSIPLAICFTPWAHYVKDGFSALSGTPVWFQSMIVTIFLANYGIRAWRREITSDT